MITYHKLSQVIMVEGREGKEGGQRSDTPQNRVATPECSTLPKLLVVKLFKKMPTTAFNLWIPHRTSLGFRVATLKNHFVDLGVGVHKQFGRCQISDTAQTVLRRSSDFSLAPPKPFYVVKDSLGPGTPRPFS